MKRCSSEGCKRFAQRGVVCIRHGAKIKMKRCSSEGCKNVAVRGGIKSSEEECALDMGQRSNDAAVNDAQIKLKKEECSSGMGQR